MHQNAVITPSYKYYKYQCQSQQWFNNYQQLLHHELQMPRRMLYRVLQYIVTVYRTMKQNDAVNFRKNDRNYLNVANTNHIMAHRNTNLLTDLLKLRIVSKLGSLGGNYKHIQKWSTHIFGKQKASDVTIVVIKVRSILIQFFANIAMSI